MSGKSGVEWNSIVESMTTHRRHLHHNPEVSFKEHETTRYIVDELVKVGLSPVRLEMGTGCYVDIPASGSDGGDRPALGIRADIDALAMAEHSTLPFASRHECVAHMCGHDVHTAIALGVAHFLALNPPSEPVRIIFQPAEETVPGGGKTVCEEGVVDGLRRIIALHCDPSRPVGTIGMKSGAITSSNAQLVVKLTGPGGHTARPHETSDLIYVLGIVLTGLPAVLDRRLDARTATVMAWGSVSGGGAFNIIPDSVQARATVRSADREVWARAENIVRDAVGGLVQPFGVQADVEWTQGVPPVLNDEAVTSWVRDSVADREPEITIEEASQSSGGEDFAWMADRVPSTYIRLGVWDGCSDIHDLHTPLFTVDERALEVGLRVFLAALDNASGAK